VRTTVWWNIVADGVTNENANEVLGRGELKAFIFLK
jgi:hypothetical protein